MRGRVPPQRDFQSFVVGNDFEFQDELQFTNGNLDSPGAFLRLTIRDESGGVIGAMHYPGGGIERVTATRFAALFLPSVTELWPPEARLKYDVQFSRTGSGEVDTQWWGYIYTLHAITLRRRPETERGVGAPRLVSVPNIFVPHAQATAFISAPLLVQEAEAIPPAAGSRAAGAPVLLESTPAFPAPSAFRDLEALGADYLHHWEPSLETVLLVGSPPSQKISSLFDRGLGNVPMLMTTPTNQPLWNATGGPNGRPTVDCTFALWGLEAGINIPAGSRVGVYAIYQLVNFGQPSAYILGFNGSPQDMAARMFRNNDGQLVASARLDGFAQQNVTITSPAASLAFTKQSTEYLATGLEGRINGALHTPNFTGNGTTRNIVRAAFGEPGGGSGAKIACLLIVNNIHINTTYKRWVIDNYFASRFSL